MSGDLIEVSGARLWHEITGDGEPVLQIHGSGFGHFNFGPITPILSRAASAASTTTSGATAAPTSPSSTTTSRSGPTTPSGMLDALGIEKAHIHGTSMGGMVATVVAGKYPDRVQSVVINCAAAKLGFCGPAGVQELDRPDRSSRAAAAASSPS